MGNKRKRKVYEEDLLQWKQEDQTQERNGYHSW